MSCWLSRASTVALLLLISSPQLGCGPSVKRPDPPTARPEGAAITDQMQHPAGSLSSDSDTSTRSISTLSFMEQNEGKLNFRYSNGAEARINSIVETLGGGVAVFDYDRDGCSDLFATGGGRFTSNRIPSGEPSQLLRGDGHWNFTPVMAGLEASRHFSHGCWAADFDNDGFADILVTGYGGLQLFHNHGDGTFADIRDAAQLYDPLWSTGAAWADVNRDGCLDLYVAHYVDWTPENHRACDDPHGGREEICGPKHYGELRDLLFLSRGDGTFTDATNTAGLIAGGKGLGVIAGDVDLDGDIDIYVANDTTDNFLYLNRGEGTFDEVGQRHGAALDDSGRPTGSMGVDLADFDGDGLPDLWTANYEHEIFGLYRNVGGGRFLHASRPMGFAAIGDRFVGWGTGFADFDRDGDLDVIAATGHVKRFPTAAPVKQQPLVWLNDRGRFIRQTFPAETYLGSSHDGRGLALGDLDDDGDVDVVIAHNDRPLAILSNTTQTSGNSLRVALVGRRSARDAIGTRIGVHVGARTEWRQITGGGSYLSQHDLRQQWGTSSSEPVDVEVHWPTGVIQFARGVQPGKTVTLIEPVPDSAVRVEP